MLKRKGMEEFTLETRGSGAARRSAPALPARMKKTHFKHDAKFYTEIICGTKESGHTVTHRGALHLAKADLLRRVTCLRCIKKLREWGFASQNFDILTTRLTD